MRRNVGLENIDKYFRKKLKDKKFHKHYAAERRKIASRRKK